MSAAASLMSRPGVLQNRKVPGPPNALSNAMDCFGGSGLGGQQYTTHIPSTEAAKRFGDDVGLNCSIIRPERPRAPTKRQRAGVYRPVVVPGVRSKRRKTKPSWSASAP